MTDIIQTTTEEAPAEVIKVLKLISGEEVIAKLTGLDEECVKMKQVRVIALHQDNMGRMGLAMIPWIHANPDAEVVIEAGHIVAATEAASHIERSYLEKLSGLSIASQMPPQGNSVLLEGK